MKNIIVEVPDETYAMFINAIVHDGTGNAYATMHAATTKEIVDGHIVLKEDNDEEST